MTIYIILYKTWRKNKEIKRVGIWYIIISSINSIILLFAIIKIYKEVTPPMVEKKRIVGELEISKIKKYIINKDQQSWEIQETTHLWEVVI